jgi:hypothetical protein
MGKNVPLKRNMGVMNKKIGRLKVSIVGIIPVKNIPIDPNAIPPRKARGSTKRPWG